MMYLPPKIDQVYREYADALLRYHNLLSTGKEGGDDEQQNEDLLDSLWERLDEAQRQSLQGMGSDLNWIRRRGGPPPKGRTPSEVTEADLRELQSAQDAEDWHAILHHLRGCAPAVPPDILAYNRATCYYKLDFIQLSMALADLTIELSRIDGRVGRLAFDVLRALAGGAALNRALQVMSSPADYAPVVVAQCIGYVLDNAVGDPATFDLARLAETIRKAHQRLNASHASREERVLFYQLAGAEMQAFGEAKEAQEIYEEGYRLDPANPEILAGLGMILYESDPVRAAGLFRKAIRHRAAFIRPYLHLAHYHVVRQEFAQAYDYAKQAMYFAREDRARAAVLDIMAIGASELGLPAEEVLGIFTQAAQLAPTSARISANLKAFRDSRNGGAAKPEWEYKEDKSVFEANEFTVRTGMREQAFAR